ncbi:cyclin-dependent kinase inhibitor 1-like [Pyxicephalus adspersus]|uniref:Cyclin-dependent kinase inhibitor domain-containing protein n=1 Tax=Pyxicephalus adspersus TaxID=30357 RepID=A0AAV3B7Q2_PYXAD|nr:TPA: hypothetical protein GDO54_001643 [Pyxicephalus adspersus]
MYSARAILLQSNSNPEKVCRNLFGPVDHERLKADCEELLNRTAEEAKKRWNFDFVNETPIEGPYKWEKVDCVNGNILCSNEDNGSDCCKRKQKLITDYYQVKRHCSPVPSPKQSCA